MRSIAELKHLKHVRIEVLAGVVLDMERVVDDPVWHRAAARYDTSDESELSLAIEDYLRAYLNQEVLLAEHPATCGPATTQAVNVSVIQPEAQVETQPTPVNGRLGITTELPVV